jgi:DNA-directed RNA polymerase subunit alpha
MNLAVQTPIISSVTDGDTPNSATFVIEPLHTGYGMTIANSFRRTMLSSIAGAGVVAFRVDGAAHEFTTVDGVVEDVLSIAQNLKGLRFRVFTDERVTLRINKKGSGPVTGADVVGSDQAEVVNKDHVIATIDNNAVTFAADIVVEKGRGYKAIDETDKEGKIADFISIDTIFSPVLRVRYKVENVRVGQMTNLDKVILIADTDGTISPREAFEEAAAILASQYTSLAGQTTVTTKSSHAAAMQDGDLDMPAQSKETSILDSAIEELNFSARTTNALVNNDIHTLRDLFSLSDAEMKELKGFGSKALDEVKLKMSEMEL